MEDPAQVEEQLDPTEAIRLFLLGVGVVINLYVLWDQYRDHPDVVAYRTRARAWWERTVAAPRRRRRELRRATGETVFEAIQIVEGAS